MKKKIRWGILGTGRIAHQFAQDMAHVDNGELIAAASREQATATAFANQYAIPKAHASYLALVEDPDIDAVYVATPHTLHYQNCLDAMRAGKAVLCEKPLTTTSAECESLLETARRTNIYLMEGMWTYFLPAIRMARQWVAAGRIGAIKHIKADFGYPLLPYDPQRREYNASLAGGSLLEMGIYPIALAWLFLERDPQEIKVVARKAANGVEDDVAMIFNYDNCVASLATSFRCKLQNWAYIIGEEGYIAIPDFWRASQCRLYRLDECIDHFDDGRQSLGFNYEIVAVGNDLLSEKRQSDVVTWDSSLRFQRHIERVKTLL